MENELGKALARAELAESQLEKYQMKTSSSSTPSIPCLPPPPPPPLPPQLLYQPSSGLRLNRTVNNEQQGAFGEPTAAYSGSKVIDTVKQHVRAETATGR